MLLLFVRGAKGPGAVHQHEIQPRFCLAALLLAASSALAQSIVFSDDFNRADAASVGNGWQDLPIGGPNIELSNGAALFQHSSAFAQITRPFTFSQTTTISATFTQTSGFGGLSSQFGMAFALLDDGTSGGYRLSFNRSDASFANSNVTLTDNGSVVGILSSSFQFTTAISVTATFALDGSISGRVAEGGDFFDFTFGSHTLTAAGGLLAFGLGGPDNRSSSFIYPTVDNIVVSVGAIPEPATYPVLAGLLASSLALIARAIRRRHAVGS